MPELVAWETWNDAGRCVRVSRAHIDLGAHTMCGLGIPSHGNGTVVGGGDDLGAQTCRACEKKSERADRLERDAVAFEERGATWAAAGRREQAEREAEAE